MKTLRINDRSFSVEVIDIARRSKWPGVETLGNIGGFVPLDNTGYVLRVLSHDNETFVPCPGQEETVALFLDGWDQQEAWNNQPTSQEAQVWDQEVRFHNEQLLAEATKVHAVKQEVMYRLHDAARYMAESYQTKEGGTLPESLNALFSQLRQMERALGREKEQFPLLGQDVEALKVNLPEGAELKNP